MERVELINKVKTRIDEVSAAGDLIVDVGIENTKPYDSIIAELLDESALEVLLKAPFYRLKISTATPTCTATADKTVGELSVPNDFLRLVSFSMEEWQQPITTLAIQGDDIAKRQSNKYIRGGVAKPIGVLKRTSKGMVIVYYSVSTSIIENDGTITHKPPTEFSYVSSAPAESIEDAQMIDAMVWICAGKTLGVLGQLNLQNLCFDNAKGLLL